LEVIEPLPGAAAAAGAGARAGPADACGPHLRCGRGERREQPPHGIRRRRRARPRRRPGAPSWPIACRDS